MKASVNTSSTHYFASFSNYEIPFKPAQELEKSELEGRHTYYIATYDQENRLIGFEKILDGERFFYDQYTYWPDSKVLKQRHMVKTDGSKTVQEFDRKGKLIKD